MVRRSWTCSPRTARSRTTTSAPRWRRTPTSLRPASGMHAQSGLSAAGRRGDARQARAAQDRKPAALNRAIRCRRRRAAAAARAGRSGCGRPKSGAGESWPISTMPRRIARVRVKCSNSASPSPRRIARVSAERSSLKRPSISSTASLLARNTSRHMVGSDAAMRVKSRKPPAENFSTSERVTVGRVRRRCRRWCRRSDAADGW